MIKPDPFRTYLDEVRRKLATGIATEHAYRGALERLLRDTGEGVQAVNGPATASAALRGGLGTGRVYINKPQYFQRVDREVWELHIGGYQVLHKWLKDRKGRKLSNDDIAHYQRVVVAIKETIRLMSEIDKAIPKWPIE